MKRSALIGMAVVGLVGFVGCSGTLKGGESTPVVATVGASGGAIEGPNGSRLEIPAGALASDVTITVSVVSDAPAPNATTVGQTLLLQPEGQQFATPVTITLAFDPSVLPSGKTAADVVILTAPANSAAYESLGQSGNASGKVSAKTTHFSTFVPAIGTAAAACATDFACAIDASPGGIISCACPGHGSSLVIRSGGHTYKTVCLPSGSCDCFQDAVKVKTVTVGARCGDADGGIARESFAACGFPCASDQADAGQQVDGGQHGGVCALACAGSGGIGGGQPNTCGCSTQVAGTSYSIDCVGTSCTCSRNQATVGSATITSCSEVSGAYQTACGFPCGGSSGTADGGVPGGGGGTADGGIASPVDAGSGGGGGPVVDAGSGGGGPVVDAGSGGGGPVVDAGSGGGGPVVDAGSGGSGAHDAGPACVENGGGGPSGCEFNRNCGQQHYRAECNTTSCACTLNGADAGSFATSNICSAGPSAFETVRNGCAWP